MKNSATNEFFRCFKKFILKELYFYWQLPKDNLVVVGLESNFNMSIEEYYKFIYGCVIDNYIIDKINNIFVKVLNIEIRAIISKENNIVKFEKYVHMEK